MNTITIRGRLASEVELRFSAQGKAWCTFTVVSSRRVKNGNEWEDADTMFLPAKVFGTHAEQIAESLDKGDPVTVVGRVVQENWETDSGDKRSRMVVIADEVAATVRQHQVKITRMDRSGGGSAGRASSGGQQRRGGYSNQHADDPWAAR
ncbi:single-stranded DNA-binding protein [Catellatospora sp. NPDC049609]|uniref:single-stranded DNA-binding protein n=1 Tax=Catellatospora sp. NPDC049609 TaxID=3155505 RepID=UPI00341F770B